jgi:hypothetical protein
MHKEEYINSKSLAPLEHWPVVILVLCIMHGEGYINSKTLAPLIDRMCRYRSFLMLM